MWPQIANSNKAVVMKFSKKRQQWENSTKSCTISVDKNGSLESADSYGWWSIAFSFGKYIVFNQTPYSNSTSKHQSEVRCFLRNDSREIISICNCRENLTVEKLGAYIDEHIKSLESAINLPDSLLRSNPRNIVSKILDIPNAIESQNKYKEFRRYYEIQKNRR